MRYKVGDRVRIKTWDQMAEEFPVSTGGSGYINCRYGYFGEMEEDLQEISSNRILTIKEAEEWSSNFCYTYMMEGIGWCWSDDMIEGLVENTDYNVIDNNISYRFELMDFEI